ncbi:MAG: hypothetical protein RMY28_006960 [Nostoc sp. ChiSLP01]|nr:hypothetical protein [Nostoc sp. CmiSLP01]MDZ8285560.1 hypothetical protein [Nostoc sp. ChiSLP01]
MTFHRRWQPTPSPSLSNPCGSDAIATLIARQNLMRDEDAHLWLEATLIEIVPTNKGSHQSQPWKDWKTAQDAINWGKEQLPHLTQAQLLDFIAETP